jgi:hypothetical protein
MMEKYPARPVRAMNRPHASAWWSEPETGGEPETGSGGSSSGGSVGGSSSSGSSSVGSGSVGSVGASEAGSGSGSGSGSRVGASASCRLVDPSELVTLTDASARLGRARSFFRVMLHRYPDGFPEPVATVGGARVYLLGDLARWLAAHRRGSR